jgi:tetratricopeptide (TPR) repeat protein
VLFRSITLSNLGNAYAELGDGNRAIEFYKQAIMIARQTGDRRGESIACWNLGDQLIRDGDLEHGIELMQVLVDYETELDHPEAEKHATYVKSLRK